MTTYTAVFGGATVPPSEASFSIIGVSTNVTLVWPYNSSGGVPATKIMELVSGASNLSVTLPSALEVSVGEDLLVRNTGGFSLTLKDASGGTIATLDPSTAKYLYLSANSTVAGSWSVLAFGSGSSAVDAAALVGYGLTAIGATLNAAHSVFPTATGITVAAAHRGKLINYTGGVGTLALTSAVTLGDNFFVLVHNSGTGTLTIDPYSSETVDGHSSIMLNPEESAMLVSSGVAWFTVGLGRSLQYNFTQLVKDVTSATSFTLSASEASNKVLKFIGTPSGAVTITVPAVVAVYYVYNALSNANTVTVTAGGVGATLAQSATAVLICDGTNVIAAQSASISFSPSLANGSVTAPALNFSAQTNTGLYRYGTYGIGFAVNGVLAAYCDYVSSAGRIYNASSEELASQAYVQAQIAAAKQAVVPAGSTTLWYSNTAPTGWTKATTSALDNCSLRIVSDGSGTGGNGGVTGGASTFASIFNSTWTGDAHTLTTGEMPSHTHTASVTDPGHTHSGSYWSGTTGGMSINSGSFSMNQIAINSATTGITVSNASQGGGGSHTHTNTINVRYASFIVASKDAY